MCICTQTYICIYVHKHICIIFFLENWNQNVDNVRQVSLKHKHIMHHFLFRMSVDMVRQVSLKHDHHYLSRKFLSECWHCQTLLPSLWWEIIFYPTHKNWICCTVNNCTSCPHCGSACERKGFYYSQMCWNTRFSICHLWVSTPFHYSLSRWLVDLKWT